VLSANTTFSEEFNVIAIGTLCLDFRTKRAEYEKELISFLEKNQTALGLGQASDLFEAYIEKVWPHELPGSMIMAHASFDGFDRYIFRPPAAGPLAGEFSSNGQVPIFNAYRKQGTLVVDKCILTAHISPRPFERYVSGQIFTIINEQQQMQDPDFNALLQLPRVHDKIIQFLQPWLEYLDWQEQLVSKRQDVLRYDKYVRADNGSVCFLVKDQKALQRIRKKRDLFMMAASLSDSQSPDSWQPPANKRIFLKRVGQLTKTQIVNLDTLPFNIDNKSDLKGEKLAIITIQPEETADLQTIPEEGFLLTSVAGDLKPISSARHAIQRLKKGQSHNWYLPYWLFDILNGAVPTSTKQLYKDVKPLLPLNDDQKAAVEKGMDPSDIMSIHGPPGTGKTECISELSRMTCRRGQRVLVASQANTAVDNALRLMKSDPSIRLIRYGNRDRLEEDAQLFLKEDVLKIWFSAVKGACQKQTQQNVEHNEKLQRASESLQRLSSIESQSNNLTRQIKDFEAHQQRLQYEQNTLSEKIRIIRQQIDQLQRNIKAIAELIEWFESSNSSPCPSVELISNESIFFELDRLIQEILNVLAMQSLILPPFLDRLTRNRWTTIEQLKNSINRSCNVDDLIEQAIELAQSTAEDQESLKSQWGRICRLLQLALINAFGTASFSALDDLIASLLPSAKWIGLLNDLKVLCQTLTGPVHKILSDGSYRLKEQLTAHLKEAEEKQAQYQQQIDQVLSEKEHIDAEESQVNEQLTSVQQQHLQIQQRWQELWPTACPDLDNPMPAPLISKEDLENRKNQFQQWYEHFKLQNPHQQSWDTIQRHWIKQLDLPGTANNMDLLKLYVANANVVGVTCLEAGQRSFYESENFKPFDLVIIDEVSKATPTDILMAIMCGRKVVLVGDHRQLPPMYKEKESSYIEALEDGSIKSEDFQRFEELITASYFEQLFTKAPETIKQHLRIQYRSHKQIMDVINIFYGGQLKCPENIEDFHKTKEHHLTIYDRFGGKFLERNCHVLWVDSSKTPSGEYFFENQVGSSKANTLEIELLIASLKLLNEAVKHRGFQPPFKHQALSCEHGLQLIEWLKQKKVNTSIMTIEEMNECKFQINGHSASPDTLVRERDLITADMRRPIGIITFYGAQLGLIRKRLKELRTQHPDHLDCLNIKTNTVDNFQGMEMPIVLVSMVRAPRSNRLGQFVREYRRINVAFSRAQKLLIIIGSAKTFREAVIDLPDINTGQIKNTNVYDTIYQLIAENGGRRYARALINKI